MSILPVPAAVCLERERRRAGVQGQPLGTSSNTHHTSFELVVEWRWAPGAAARLERVPNSGVLMCREPASRSRRACRACTRPTSRRATRATYGFWACRRRRRRSAARSEGPRIARRLVGFRKTEAAEKPEGEWNVYKITLDGPGLVVFVNGKKVNEARGALVLPARIGLLVEGGESTSAASRHAARQVIRRPSRCRSVAVAPSRSHPCAPARPCYNGRSVFRPCRAPTDLGACAPQGGPMRRRTPDENSLPGVPMPSLVPSSSRAAILCALLPSCSRPTGGLPAAAAGQSAPQAPTRLPRLPRRRRPNSSGAGATRSRMASGSGSTIRTSASSASRPAARPSRSTATTATRTTRRASFSNAVKWTSELEFSYKRLRRVRPRLRLLRLRERERRPRPHAALRRGHGPRRQPRRDPRRLRLVPVQARDARRRGARRLAGDQLGREHLHPGRHQRHQPGRRQRPARPRRRAARRAAAGGRRRSASSRPRTPRSRPSTSTTGRRRRSIRSAATSAPPTSPAPARRR